MRLLIALSFLWLALPLAAEAQTAVFEQSPAAPAQADVYPGSGYCLGGDLMCPVCQPGMSFEQCRCRCTQPNPTPTVNPFPTSPPVVPPGQPQPTAPPLPTSLPGPGFGNQCILGQFFCPATHTYVILGDSIAAGLTAVEGYAAEYEDFIERDNHIEIDDHNLAQSGWSSGDLAAAFTSSSPLQQSLGQADIITWNIGGNDLRQARLLYQQGACGGEDNQECLRQIVGAFRTNWNQIVQVMVQQRVGRPVMIRSMDIYNPYVLEDQQRDSWPNDGGQSDFEVLMPYWQAANAHIGQTLQAASVPYARVSDIFNGPNGMLDPEQIGLISFDGFHPNERGHETIARLLRQTGYVDLPAAAPGTLPPSRPPRFPVQPIPTAPIGFPPITMPTPLPTLSPVTPVGSGPSWNWPQWFWSWPPHTPCFEGPLPGPGQGSSFGRPCPVGPGRPGLPPDFEGPLPGPGQPPTGRPIVFPGNPWRPPADFEGPLPGPGQPPTERPIRYPFPESTYRLFDPSSGSITTQQYSNPPAQTSRSASVFSY